MQPCNYHAHRNLSQTTRLSKALDLLEQADYLRLKGHPTLQRILPGYVRRSGGASRAPPLHARLGCGRMANLDLAVLRKDKQLPTHITPTIYTYAQGYFREDLEVVGAKPPAPVPGLSRQDARKRVLELLKRRAKKPRIEVVKASRRGTRYAEIKADGVTYRVSPSR